MTQLTDYQTMALTDLRDGNWHPGDKVRGRNALVSLHKRRLVEQERYKKCYAMRWQITPEGLAALREYMPHLFELQDEHLKAGTR